jgi:hypothetical protein
MVCRFELEPIVGVSEAKAVWEKSCAGELYFWSSRVARLQIGAPFGVDCLPIQPRNFSFSVLGPWRDRSSAQSANVIIRTELSAVITPFSCAADFLCRRDVAQPGRALAWGARGRQFKSARPDQTNSK